MSDDCKFGIGACICIVVMVIAGLASSVGESRAKAIQACFEAAKVNHNIKCDFAD